MIMNPVRIQNAVVKQKKVSHIIGFRCIRAVSVGQSTVMTVETVMVLCARNVALQSIPIMTKCTPIDVSAY